MNAPAAKDFSTAQAQAALSGLVLALVNDTPDDVPTYTLTGHAQQVDFTYWAQVTDFLKGASHA